MLRILSKSNYVLKIILMFKSVQNEIEFSYLAHQKELLGGWSSFFDIHTFKMHNQEP